MQLERGIPEKDIDDTLTFLLESGFIHLQGGATVRYAATKLGQACCAASVDPDVALEMYSELSSAYFREQSLLQHELHLMYLILLPVAAKDLVINISTYAGMVAEFCRSLAGPNLCRCWDNSRAPTIWM